MIGVIFDGKLEVLTSEREQLVEIANKHKLPESQQLEKAPIEEIQEKIIELADHTTVVGQTWKYDKN